MYLFLDTLSDPCSLILFDKKRNIQDSRSWTGKRKEFDTLIEEIDDFISKNSLSYKDLAGIVVIIWPGSFTGTRVTTLIANTLAYSFKTPLSPLTVGEFFAFQNIPTPWIIPVTKKEVLLWKTNNPKDYSLTKIEELDDASYASMTPIDFSEGKSTIRLAHDYASVVCGLDLHASTTKVQPLYAKTPNITTPSPHAWIDTRHR